MILVTGGAGYIGSHTCLALLQAGEAVTVLDNFSNSQPEALARVQRIAGRSLQCVRGDVRDTATVAGVLRSSGAQAVIHFAGLKAVGESAEKPLHYYQHNVEGSLHLLQAMAECGVKTIVFSSSATVYGVPVALPYTESHPLCATNVYGRTKLVVEDMLRDLYASDASWRMAVLRYFNPIGAHESGLIGEDPQGVPNNLLPYVAQVAVGRREHLTVWGDDYPTRDGTGVRDYIHVVDLAEGHLKALQRLRQGPQCLTLNLGTGQGCSVLELVHAFEQASGLSIARRVGPRRVGDVAESYGDPTLAQQLLGWRATRDIAAMCADTWRWQSANPYGYSPAP